MATRYTVVTSDGAEWPVDLERHGVSDWRARVLEARGVSAEQRRARALACDWLQLGSQSRPDAAMNAAVDIVNGMAGPAYVAMVVRDAVLDPEGV